MKSYSVFCGLDVGKQAHHACALDPGGRRLFDAELPQDEASLRELLQRLQAHGPVLVVVDQPNTIGALPVAVARSMGIDVAYLPGLAMRRIADLHPGNAKTDARWGHLPPGPPGREGGAYVIADAARVMPHTLRRIDVGEDALAELTVLVGYDDDLASEATRLANRIRGLLTQVHPALERVLGPRVQQKAGLALIAKYGGPAGMRKAGRARLAAAARKSNPRGAQGLADAVWAALAEQTVVVPGTAAAETVLPRLAASLAGVLDQRRRIAAEVERVLDAHPLAEVLTSMPGVGVRTAARILIEVGWGHLPPLAQRGEGGASSFPTAGHLAAYAGLAPVTRRSGTSIRGEHPSRSGNKHLKRALFLSAFAALRADPTSRAYYDRKRAEGKKHNAALICLARRRCDVLHAMLKHHQTYQPRIPAAAA